MTRKKTKQAKGLIVYAHPHWDRNPGLVGFFSAGETAAYTKPMLLLDASDAGREALRERIAKAIYENISTSFSWAEATEDDRKLMFKRANAVLAEIGLPAPSKKGRK